MERFPQFTSRTRFTKNNLKIFEDIAINALLKIKNKRIWLGGRARAGGICRLIENPQPNQKIVDSCYTDKDGLSSDWVSSSIDQTSDGTIWISTVIKLTQLNGFDESGKPNFRILAKSRNGITNKETERRTFWKTATGMFGLLRPTALRKFPDKVLLDTRKKTDWQPQPHISAQYLKQTKSELIVTDHPNERNINVFRNGEFTAIKPNYPPEIDYWGWGGKHAVLQTRNGEWWVITGSSPAFQNKYGLKHPNSPILIRFPSVNNPEDLAKVQPKKIYHTADVPNVIETFQIYEDRNQDLWIMAFGEAAYSIAGSEKPINLLTIPNRSTCKSIFFKLLPKINREIYGLAEAFRGNQIQRNLSNFCVTKTINFKSFK